MSFKIYSRFLSGLVEINVVLFTQEPPVPNMHVLVVFSSTDALKWTKQEDDLPDAH